MTGFIRLEISINLESELFTSEEMYLLLKF